jgi:hypothetical protein
MVPSLVVHGGSNGVTMDFYNAILWGYAEAVNVRSKYIGVHPLLMEAIWRGGLLTNSSRIRRVFAQRELLLWIKQHLPLPPLRRLQFGRHFASKRLLGVKVTLRDGASVADARSRQPTYMCSTCMHKIDGLQKQLWFCNPTTVE